MTRSKREQAAFIAACIQYPRRSERILAHRLGCGSDIHAQPDQQPHPPREGEGESQMKRDPVDRAELAVCKAIDALSEATEEFRSVVFTGREIDVPAVLKQARAALDEIEKLAPVIQSWRQGEKAKGRKR